MLNFLVIGAFILSCLISGIAIQSILVIFPARKKLGDPAYANMHRALDLGNGLFLYPFLAIGGAVIEIAAFILANMTDGSGSLVIPLGFSILCKLGVLLITAKAAPQMIQLGKSENKKQLIKPLLDRFIFYSRIRAVFIWLEFLSLLWALLR